MKRLTLQLNPVPPFSLGLTVWCLRRRPDNIVDRWVSATYRRVLVIENVPVGVTVHQEGSTDEPTLEIGLLAERFPRTTKKAVVEALGRLLGLHVDLTLFYRMAKDDSRLKELARRFYGLKPPRFPSLFEALVNGIACQQFTLASGIRLLNRLTEAYGPAFSLDGEVAHAFPGPEDLADAKPEDLRSLGFSTQKARAILDLSGNIVSGSLDLQHLETLDDAAAMEQLLKLHGVGRWTSQYTLLRGLGRTHIFPADDVGGRNNLAHWLQLDKSLDYEGTHRLLDIWKPYAGLIFFHLLLYRLAEKGVFDEDAFH